MSPTIEERLASVETGLARSERKPKDFWDKFQIVATLLIPAEIAFVGYIYTKTEKQWEIESAEHIAAQQQATTQIQARVGQAQLVSTFMEALLSTNAERQHLASEAILVALPADGPRLLAVISQDKSRPGAQAAAQSSLDSRRSLLIQNCFSDDKATRISATAELIQGWQDDPKLVPEILSVSRHNLSNLSGIINTLVVLENVKLTVLASDREEVQTFLESVRSNGPQTESHVKLVEARLARGTSVQ